MIEVEGEKKHDILISPQSVSTIPMQRVALTLALSHAARNAAIGESRRLPADILTNAIIPFQDLNPFLPSEPPLKTLAQQLSTFRN